MGSPLDEPSRTVWEGPQHVVTITKPFAVSKYELTFADWDTCAAFGECDSNIVDSEFGRGRLRWSRLSEQLFRVDKWSVCRG